MRAMLESVTATGSCILALCELRRTAAGAACVRRRRGADRDRPLSRRSRLQPRRIDRAQRPRDPRPGRGRDGRADRGDRRLRRVRRPDRGGAAGERARQRSRPPLRPQPWQGVRGQDRRARVTRPVGGLLRRRPRPRPRVDPRVRSNRRARRARLRHRLQAASRFSGELPELASCRVVALPAARADPFPARRSRHASRTEGLPPRDRRPGRTAAAGEALRLRHRTAGGRTGIRLQTRARAPDLARLPVRRDGCAAGGGADRAHRHGRDLLPAARAQDLSAQARTGRRLRLDEAGGLPLGCDPHRPGRSGTSRARVA